MRERFNDLANQASEGYNVARDNAYSTARQYPGTLAAIVVGIGVTAFLIWAARRAGGWQNLQSTATDYMRDGYARAREGYENAREVIRDRASRIKGQAQQVAE
jgi:hypothetical protein